MHTINCLNNSVIDINVYVDQIWQLFSLSINNSNINVDDNTYQLLLPVMDGGNVIHKYKYYHESVYVTKIVNKLNDKYKDVNNKYVWLNKSVHGLTGLVGDTTIKGTIVVVLKQEHETSVVNEICNTLVRNLIKVHREIGNLQQCECGNFSCRMYSYNPALKITIIHNTNLLLQQKGLNWTVDINDNICHVNVC